MSPLLQLAPPFVSVQDLRRGDAAAGHLAWGDLATPSLVAVHDTAWAEDAAADFEILLASPLPDGGGFVERIRPERIDIVRRALGTAEQGAVVRLARPSRHPAPHPDPVLSARSGDVASGPDAAAVAGALPRTSALGTRGADSVLSDIVGWEADQRRRLVRHNSVPPGVVQVWWCFLFGGCWGSERPRP